MKNATLLKSLNGVFADMVSLSFKTQSYHWHVRGPNFFSLHTMFEGQYKELAAAVDEVAERIITLGGVVAANFSEVLSLRTLSDANASLASPAMISDLQHGHELVVKSLHNALKLAEEIDDQATMDLLIVRIEAHQKTIWMLSASL